jgi:hypothetical protein
MLTYFTNNINIKADIVMKQATGIKFVIEDALSKIE